LINGYGLIIGHNTYVDSEAPNVEALVQQLGTGRADTTSMIARFSADASAPAFIMASSRNATIGSSTVVQDGDTLGVLQFHGDDGTDIETTSSYIRGSVDGTPSSNDVPGKLEFVTYNSSGTGVTALTIDSSQNVGIGTGVPTSQESVGTFLHITDSASAGIVLEGPTNSEWEIFAKSDDLYISRNA